MDPDPAGTVGLRRGEALEEDVDRCDGVLMVLMELLVLLLMMMMIVVLLMILGLAPKHGRHLDPPRYNIT